MADGGNNDAPLPHMDQGKMDPNIKGLDLWGVGDLNADFDFLNMPEESYAFGIHPTTINTPGNTGSLFEPTPPATSLPQAAQNSVTDSEARQGGGGGAQDFLVNHYENILKQNRVSMKEAMSPNQNYMSPGGATTTGAAPSPPVTTAQRPQPQTRPSQQRTRQVQQQTQTDSRQNSSTGASCDHCRRRQIKCVTVPNLTHCIQCESKGLKCTYSDSIYNPKLKRNMGVLSDEPNKRTRLAPSPQNWMQQPPSMTSPQQQQQQQQFRRPQQPLQYPRSSFFVGSSSMYDTALLERIRLDKIDQVQLNRSLSLRKVSPDVQFILRDDYTDELALSAERSVDQVEAMVAPHGPALVQIYFRIIHPSFPILHKKVFLEKYSRSYREFSAPLLAAVYSIAIKWWDDDQNLSAHPKPDVDALNDIALKTFFDVTERPRLSAVQAGLLILQSRSENPNNWILCQQVVSLAEELGLGLDCHDWKLPKWERGLRRRLAWAVWIQEKWTALTESRVSHLTLGKNWLVRNISNEDFPEITARRPNMSDEEYKSALYEHEVARNLFQEQIQLSLIVSDILDTFYTYAAQKTVTRIDQVLKLAKPLQLKLRQWYHSLPQNLQLSHTAPDKLTPIGCLHLAYFAAEITLHRKIILSLTSDVPPELVKVCRAAATTRLTTVLEFVKNLRKEHLNAFWQASASSNLAIVGTFAAILFVTSKVSEEAAMFKEHVNSYRSVLQQLGRLFTPARLASMRIDMLLLQVPGLIRDFVPIAQMNSYVANANANNNTNNNTSNLSAKNTPTSMSNAAALGSNSSSNTPNTNNQPTSTSNANTPFSSHSPHDMHMMSPFLSQQMNMNLPASQSMPNNQPTMKRGSGGGPPVTTTEKKNSPNLVRSPLNERHSPQEMRINGDANASNKPTPTEGGK